MADELLVWDRAEVKKQLGRVSDAFLDALTAKGYLSPIYRGRFLPEEVRACIVRLKEERDKKPRKKDGTQEEEGQPVPSVGEDRTGAEGPEALLRGDPGESRPKGKRDR